MVYELNNNKVGRFRLLTSVILLFCVSQAYEYNNLVNNVWFSGLLSPKGNYNKALWLKGDKIIIQRTYVGSETKLSAFDKVSLHHVNTAVNGEEDHS